jgi:hypothetical protein
MQHNHRSTGRFGQDRSLLAASVMGEGWMGGFPFRTYTPDRSHSTQVVSMPKTAHAQKPRSLMQPKLMLSRCPSITHPTTHDIHVAQQAVCRLFAAGSFCHGWGCWGRLVTKTFTLDRGHLTQAVTAPTNDITHCLHLKPPVILKEWSWRRPLADENFSHRCRCLKRAMSPSCPPPRHR